MDNPGLSGLFFASRHNDINPKAADDIQFLLRRLAICYKGIHLLHGAGYKEGFLSKFAVVHQCNVFVCTGNELALDIHHCFAEFRESFGGDSVGTADEQVD